MMVEQAVGQAGEAGAVWDQTLSLIRTKVNDFVYNAFFKPLRARALEGERLQLEIHDQFNRDWIEDHYRFVIEEALSALAAQGFTSVRTFDLGINPLLEDARQNVPTPAAQEITVRSAPQATADRRLLNEKYTFDTFVVGPSNQFAFAASRAVADRPAIAYNPLFLFGGVGLGKTHLINAIAQGILKSNPSYRVIYTSSEQFMNEVINGIRYGKMEEFHNKYR